MYALHRTALVVLLISLALPVHAQDGTQPITASDLLNVQQLGDVSVSPDGRNVLYSVRSVHEKKDEEGEYEYRTHLWLYEAQSGDAPRPLTQGAESASEAAWHPDGSKIAFVRTVDDNSQVFVLSLLGGEAYQLTDFEHGVSSPSWSPDGSQLLVSTSLSHQTMVEEFEDAQGWPGERPGWSDQADDVEANPDGSVEEVRAWLEQNRRDGNPRVLNRLDFQGEFDLQPELSYRHLYVYDVPENSSRTAPLEIEPTRLTEGYFSFGGGEWLPNGNQILVSGWLDTDEHPDRLRESAIYIVDVDRRVTRQLLEMDDYAIYNPSVSPQGGVISFLATRLDDPSYGQNEIGIYWLDGSSEPELLTREFDRSASNASWSPDGWHLYLTSNSDGGTPLYRITPFERTGIDPPDIEADTLDMDTTAVDTANVDVFDEDVDDEPVSDEETAEENEETSDEETIDAPTVERLTDFAQGVRSFDVSSGSIYYVLTNPSNPFELYANNTQVTSERRLSNHNARWLEDKRLAEPEQFTVTRHDTLEIDGWMIRPTFYEAGDVYPLLLQIHGGPSAMWGPGEASMWHEFQYFASRGYGVVFSNPRGSGGYGREFQASNYRDWGHGPAGDVLAAASHAAEQDWTDPNRQVITGGSYAGYLTAWIIAHDHRFEAAASQRGVYDLSTFLGEGNAWRLIPSHFGGYPWEGPRPGIEDTLLTSHLVTEYQMLEEEPEVSPREALIANSPLTYVDQIETPLLIIHADTDLRTGVVQSEILYRSLKILEKPVEYVRYPGAGHDLSRTGDPKQRIDRILRMHEFFERFIENQPPEALAVPAENDEVEAAF